MGATAAMWIPAVQELALRGARSLPVELPGHGFDTVFPEGYACPQDLDTFAAAPSPVAGMGLEDYVAHVLGLVRAAAAVGPVVLVGHSLGGTVVTRVANEAPEMLESMVYVCAYCCVEADNVLGYAPRDMIPRGCWPGLGGSPGWETPARPERHSATPAAGTPRCSRSSTP